MKLSLSLTVFGLPVVSLAQPRMETAKESSTAAIDIAVETPESEVMDVGRQARAPGAADLPLEEPLDPGGYVCGSGDVFELRFWGTQNLSISITADLEGNAFIPKVGKVRIAGKSLTNARAIVLGAVRRYYPGLRSDLALIRPRQFVVQSRATSKRLDSTVPIPGCGQAQSSLRPAVDGSVSDPHHEAQWEVGQGRFVAVRAHWEGAPQSIFARR